MKSKLLQKRAIEKYEPVELGMRYPLCNPLASLPAATARPYAQRANHVEYEMVDPDGTVIGSARLPIKDFHERFKKPKYYVRQEAEDHWIVIDREETDLDLYIVAECYTEEEAEKFAASMNE